jgi:hypothetical protein
MELIIIQIAITIAPPCALGYMILLCKKIMDLPTDMEN